MNFESFIRWAKRNKVRLAAGALVAGAIAPQLQPTITAIGQVIEAHSALTTERVEEGL